MAKSKGKGRGNPNPIFSEKTFQRTKTIYKSQAIMNAPESMPNLRKEIARVFHQANRRIQNLQKANVLSPALKALNIVDNTKFSQFAMSGKTWLELRIEYARAIEFLKQPTSTAQGAREFGKHVKESLNLSDKDFDRLKNKMMGNTSQWDERERRYVEEYLFRYSDFKEIYKEEEKSLADRIEEEGYKTDNAHGLIKPFQDDVKEMMGGAETLDEINNVLNNLHGFENNF